MQESLYDTVAKFQKERKVNVEELETILDSDIEEVVSLCKKACLKPKTDNTGNAYFTTSDVDVIKKMKELYSQARSTQKQIEENEQNTESDMDLVSPNQKVNFLTKAKSRMRAMTTVENQSYGLQANLQKLESSLISKFSDILSEKMDGFDEIIVELIRSKTENENLRTQVNDLNKQVFNLKKELALYTPLPFGFYTKRESDEL